MSQDTTQWPGSQLAKRWIERFMAVSPGRRARRWDPMVTHTYTLANGKVIYSKGNDHIVDAVRCAMLVRDQERLDAVEVIVPMVTPVATDPIFW